jgi:hypothetical protein
MSTKSNRTATRPTRPAKGKARTALKARASTKAASRKSTPITSEPTGSKQSQLIAMLRSPAGGTIEQLTELTGWQPHTVRGTISGGLRKRLKLNVTCVDHVYRIAEGQA